MLDLHLSPFVGTGEHRIRSEVRERVAGITSDNFLNEAAPKEQRAERRQRKHHERELRVATPPLAVDERSKDL